MSGVPVSDGSPPLTVDRITQDEKVREEEAKPVRKQTRWKMFNKSNAHAESSSNSLDHYKDEDPPPKEKWSLGILNDRLTEEVPGTVLLLSSNRNEPLGLRHQPEAVSGSSLPSAYRTSSIRSLPREKKKTADGQMILNPQPEDTPNDPLNWAKWRRDSALLSLGFYCMLGGGMTPILAAGFTNVGQTYGVSSSRIALTTGLYMMGLGVGSVIFSPTAILFGKRPVYLFASLLFILSAVWCAKSPSFGSLAAARVFQGIAVSPVECLPSATIAEIFFLHERAFRVGIYTLLLLGGKNLIPLVSAAVIQSLGWRWVFWIVAIVIGFCIFLLFFFVPETFWDRTPRPKPKSPRPATTRSFSNLFHHGSHPAQSRVQTAKMDHSTDGVDDTDMLGPMSPKQERLHKNNHVGFLEPEAVDGVDGAGDRKPVNMGKLILNGRASFWDIPPEVGGPVPKTPDLHGLNSPFYLTIEDQDEDYIGHHLPTAERQGSGVEQMDSSIQRPEPALHSDVAAVTDQSHRDSELAMYPTKSPADFVPSKPLRYTTDLRQRPPKTFVQTLKPWNGRLTHVSWFRVMLRPFVLFAYPAVLWSALVYSLSIGWLIVLSESVSKIYRNKETYNFSAIGTGLVYLSPFIGGVLGTAVAGKVSDIIVRYMSKRNGGVYEPEFRLVMAIPVAIATAIGLMGFGWSADEHDRWIVPTIFFGIISFGCSLGSTTSITFCLDSYRQYAGEALVTLNFSKNIFHGLIFSLFFVSWLDSDGPKTVFLVIGGIQIACLLTSIPMYIYGKRARMWTVRKNLMAGLEKVPSH